MATAVADATVGLAMLIHTPKGMMFTIGILSIMVAGDILPADTRLTGDTISVDGATPKLHFNIAPELTRNAIIDYLL
jgi:hypothetical protein